MKELTKADFEKEIQSPVVIILFYMSGCSHCDTVKEDFWNGLQNNNPPGVNYAQIESEEIPKELGVTGFPTFKKYKNGKDVKTVSGEIKKNDIVVDGKTVPGFDTQLVAESRSGGRRRRSRSTRRRIPLRPKLSPTRKRRGRVVRRI